MGKKVLLSTMAIATVGVGVAGILANTKRARVKRIMRKTGQTMYTVGTILRTLSCQVCE